MKTLRAMGLLLTLIVIAGAAFAGEKKPDERVYKAAVDEDGVQRVEVTGGEYYFDPNHIIVRINTPVELIVNKTSGVIPHDIVMREPDAGMDFKVSLGTEPKTIKFTPAKTGKYAFYCDKKLLFFKSHRDRGMEGVLEVTAD